MMLGGTANGLDTVMETFCYSRTRTEAGPMGPCQTSTVMFVHADSPQEESLLQQDSKGLQS